MQTCMQIKGRSYNVLACEKGYIFHPSILGIAPVWKDSSPFLYNLSFQINDYQLTLQDMWVHIDCALPVVNDIKPKIEIANGQDGFLYEDMNIPLQYSGAVLLADKLEGDYGFLEDFPCYCYKVVLEYIFENGILVTTIDHSKAMKRIRKNIDLGYRDLNKRRDVRCINQFIKTSLVGNYKLSKKDKKIEKELRRLRESYQSSGLIHTESINL